MRLEGMKAISGYTGWGDEKVLGLHRNSHFPMRMIGGIWEATTEAIDLWRKGEGSFTLTLEQRIINIERRLSSVDVQTREPISDRKEVSIQTQEQEPIKKRKKSLFGTGT
jgi:hypothetical protein